jgi:hypothetical protein
MSVKWPDQSHEKLVSCELSLILMDTSHRLMTYSMQIIPKMISHTLDCKSPLMLISMCSSERP